MAVSTENSLGDLAQPNALNTGIRNIATLVYSVLAKVQWSQFPIRKRMLPPRFESRKRTCKAARIRRRCPDLKYTGMGMMILCTPIT